MKDLYNNEIKDAFEDIHVLKDIDKPENVS